MRKCAVLFFLVVILTLSASVAQCEKVEWYFPIIKFDNGGNSCTDGEGLIFFPGTVEELKPGEIYKMYRKVDGKMRYVADAEVVRSMVWESNVIIHLNQGESILRFTDVVKVKVDLDKGFNFWWKKGTDWENQNNCYDAFRAFYRALLYRPGDSKVDTAYRRTGYGDYLNQGEQAMKQKRFRSAISLFKMALKFTWQGGDQSKAIKNIEKCKELMTTEKDALGERLASAYKSIKEEQYFKALCEIRKVWLSYTAPFGKAEEKTEAQKQMKNAWKYAWRSAKRQTSKLLNKRNYNEAYKIVLAFGKFIPIIQKLNLKDYLSYRAKIEKNLPKNSQGAYINASLSGLAAIQQKDGAFATNSNSSSDEKAMLTGLALAAFARAGNTLKTGKYSEVVTKAWGFITRNKTADGALFVENSITPHIFCTYGISELLNESCDDDVRGILEPCIRYLTKNQTEQGEFGKTMEGIDPLFDLSFASIAYYNAAESGIIVPLIVLDKLKKIGYEHAGTEGKPRIWKQPEAKEGSPEEIFALGAVLSLMRASGGNLVGKSGMPALRKSLTISPSREAYCPEGWLLISWAQSEFPNDQWSDFRKKVLEIATSFSANPIETERRSCNKTFSKEVSALFCLNNVIFNFSRDFGVFEKTKK